MPGFHSISSKLRRTMLGEPEVWYIARPGKTKLAGRYLAQRNHLLIATKMDTLSGRLTALWSPVASFGSGWMPVTVDDEKRAKALAAWLNSTPARLMLLNRRARKLTYPSWSLQHLRELCIPRPDNPAWDDLESAWHDTCEMELLPMRQAEECEVRPVIDEAAAQALGIDPQRIADWRRRLAAEPTVSNVQGPVAL